MHKASDGRLTAGTANPIRIGHFFSVFQYTGRALGLVWSTSRPITLLLGSCSVLLGAIPAAIAYVGKLIVDTVVAGGAAHAITIHAVTLVAVELALALALAASQRGITVCDSLLRALLAQRVNELILEKALTLTLAEFEDSEFYDQMTSARREASYRPLALVRKAFGLVQNGISVVVYGGLLLRLSGWTALVLGAAAIPAFVVETSFSQDAFRLFRWRAPESRMQTYLETLLAREDHAKEVTLFGLGPLFMGRYRAIFDRIYGEDRALALRQGVIGFVLGTLSTLAFYGIYVWVVLRALARAITLGDMTMYLLVFRQGQNALASILSSIGGMYEDNLYLSNLYEFLGHPTRAETGTGLAGPLPDDGLRFENVSFSYPGSSERALESVNLHVPRGKKLALVGENGAGKTTLIKLLTRLYEPTEGRILLDGLDLREWKPDALRSRIGVIFQDFIRYQLKVGENVGAGDVTAFEDAERWKHAAEMGMAAAFINDLPAEYQTQLGKWFKDGRELSIGQWQKIALSRAFMRAHADILVLDEPTASMDAEAEAEVFHRFRSLSDGRIGIVISHRFSTVRMADRIAVLQGGRVTEHGTHEELIRENGRYARLFNLQAEGYR